MESTKQAQYLEYVGRLWDGTCRTNWLTRLCNADIPQRSPTMTAEQLQEDFLIGLAQRAMTPGCNLLKAMPIWSTDQKELGIAALTALIGQGNTVVVDYQNMLEKDAARKWLNKWCTIIDCSKAKAKDNLDDLKWFTAKTADQIRYPYDNGKRDFPRTGGFAIIANQDTVNSLRENRRFMPVDFKGRVLTGEIEAERNQIWREVTTKILLAKLI
jgi:predicted P-loop ATPase